MIHSTLDSNGLRVDVVSGASAVLALLPSLQPSFEKWHQLEESTELPFLLSIPASPKRRPLLLLLQSPGFGANETPQLVGAVLLFAYGASLFGNRLLAHPDLTGRRCVFGPASARSRIAAVAARTFLERDAALLNLPYRIEDEKDEGPEGTPEELAFAMPRQQALCTLGLMGSKRTIESSLSGVARRLDLQLQPELDATLKKVGKRTRRNLRAATRRCARDMGAIFLWNPELSEADLAEINAESTHPVRSGVIRWRRTVGRQVPGAFLAGLRNARGDWMALAGGRRIGDTVTLDWQMNPRRFARFSVSLVMRGFLMAHLGADGVTRLRFEGGTTHTLARGFRTGIVYTLRARRPSFWLSALERILLTFFPSRAITRSVFGGVQPSPAPAAQLPGNVLGRKSESVRRVEDWS